MNLLATIVAAYGLIQNSTAVVIGAMIIAMLLGPINGLALGLNDGNFRLLRRAGSAEVVGVVVVLVTATLIGKIHVDLPITDEIMARTAPNIIDLIIALAGGAAGAYAVVSPKLKASVVGVAIATALVPPLASAGILFARGNNGLALGAFILFFTNLVTIQFASASVFWIFGLHAHSQKDSGFIEMCRRNIVTISLVLALGIVLVFSFINSANVDSLNRKMRRDLTKIVGQLTSGANVTDIRVSELSDRIDVFCILHSPLSFSPELVKETEELLNQNQDKPVNLTVRSILTKEANNRDWLHLGEDTENTASPPDPSPKSEEPIDEIDQIIPPKQPGKQPISSEGDEFPPGGPEKTFEPEPPVESPKTAPETGDN